MPDQQRRPRGQVPAPYQYQFTPPQAPRDAGRAGGARRRRGANPPRPRLAWGRIALFALLLALLTAAFLNDSHADWQLKALRDERAAAAAEHAGELGYFVQMRRVSGYKDLIDRYAQEFQVDRSFISAIIARESHYDPNAVAGSTGALGLMQLLETTGEWIAQRLGVADYRFERLREPELNIRFGAWYLAYLSGQFGGNPLMVAAAYHAGANNVKTWAMNYAADQKTMTLEQIPKDNTRDYVQKVMTAYALFYEYDSAR
ncbi:MAG: lytic transglycosylase domain-containing protein [Christensenellales bacterium]